MDHKAHSTEYVKTMWEKEGGMNISEEEWTAIWKLQWKCTNSQRWKEYGWKTVIRYFITPCQKTHYDGKPPNCWRKCGEQRANHFHILWNCPIIRQYWRDIHVSLQDIFKCVFPFGMKTVYFGCLPQEWKRKDNGLLSILLVASKKSITKRWLSQDSPTISEWWNTTLEIYKMEQMTALINQKQDQFLARWEKWVVFIKNKKPDLILS